MSENRSSQSGIELDPDQAAAWRSITAGQNVFLTGAAGTGKSALLAYVLEGLESAGKRVAVTAMTGCAAELIGGTTLHKAMGYSVFKEVGGFCKIDGSVRELDVLIIDEVSMLSAEFLHHLVREVAAFRRKGLPPERQRELQGPLAGLQLALSGDFLQLPPVVKRTSEEVERAKKDMEHKLRDDTVFTPGRIFYEAPFLNRFLAFQAAAWQRLGMKTHILTHVHRQEDPQFVQILHEIRLGIQTEQDIRFLAQRCSRPLGRSPDGILPTELFSTNREVDCVNNRELAALPGPPWTFHAADGAVPRRYMQDSDSAVERREKKLLELLEEVLKDSRIPRELTLKIGTQVMLCANLSQRNPYLVNGSRGIVVGFVRGVDYLAAVKKAFDEMTSKSLAGDDEREGNDGTQDRNARLQADDGVKQEGEEGLQGPHPAKHPAERAGHAEQPAERAEQGIADAVEALPWRQEPLGRRRYLTQRALEALIDWLVDGGPGSGISGSGSDDSDGGAAAGQPGGVSGGVRGGGARLTAGPVQGGGVVSFNPGRPGQGQWLPVVKFASCARPVVICPEVKTHKVRSLGEISRMQLPLILAWALSIHKSQGASLDRVKVNMGMVFAPGQAYVALSRARTMEGLQIQHLTPGKIMVLPEAKRFYASGGVWQQEVHDFPKQQDLHPAFCAAMRERRPLTLEQFMQALEEEDSCDLNSQAGVYHLAASLFKQNSRAARQRVDRARAEVLGGGKLFAIQEERGGTLIGAQCWGSSGEAYSISLRLISRDWSKGRVEAGCSCPSGRRDPICKHSLALLMWRLQRFAGPASGFRAAAPAPQRLSTLPAALPSSSSTPAPSAPTLPPQPATAAAAPAVAPTTPGAAGTAGALSTGGCQLPVLTTSPPAPGGLLQTPQFKPGGRGRKAADTAAAEGGHPAKRARTSGGGACSIETAGPAAGAGDVVDHTDEGGGVKCQCALRVMHAAHGMPVQQAQQEAQWGQQAQVQAVSQAFTPPAGRGSSAQAVRCQLPAGPAVVAVLGDQPDVAVNVPVGIPPLASGPSAASAAPETPAAGPSSGAAVSPPPAEHVRAKVFAPAANPLLPGLAPPAAPTFSFDAIFGGAAAAASTNTPPAPVFAPAPAAAGAAPVPTPSVAAGGSLGVGGGLGASLPPPGSQTAAEDEPLETGQSRGSGAQRGDGFPAMPAGDCHTSQLEGAAGSQQQLQHLGLGTGSNARLTLRQRMALRKQRQAWAARQDSISFFHII